MQGAFERGETIRRDVIVVGGSAGSVAAMQQLLAGLPGDLPAVIAVVIHRAPSPDSQLARVLGQRSALAVVVPADGERSAPGRVYLAPPDRHLVFEGERLRIDPHGPKVHWARPAIDPLFVSAARSFGVRVVGVLLSGGGRDGSQGTIAIKEAGGLSLVQDPHEAACRDMPRNAILHGRVDAVLPVAGVAAALTALARGEPARAPAEACALP